MSLTSLIKKDPEIRRRFREEFPYAVTLANKPLLVAPQSDRYFLIGTAFDYLLRFYISSLNPKAKTSEWFAKRAFNYIDPDPLGWTKKTVPVEFRLDKKSLFILPKTELTTKAIALWQMAEEEYEKFRKTKQVDRDLVRACLGLAHLDIVGRSGQLFDANSELFQREDVSELENLISVVDKKVFKAKKICLLNPTFGKASALVGGADANLFIDGALIEIKTTKHLRLEREYLDQLLGYYILHQISGIGALRPKVEITHLAVYFSRHAYLYTIDIKNIIDPARIRKFVSWFKEAVSTKIL